MANFNTIHIFGYGETQLIKENFNKKYKTTTLTKVAAVISDIISKSGKTITPNTYHSINIFNNHTTVYTSKTDKTENFKVQTSDLNQTKLKALIAEIEAL